MNLRQKFMDRVWVDIPRPWPVELGVRAARLAFAVGRDIRDGYLGLHATSLVYTTLLSLAPVLAISFSVLKGFGVHNQVEPFLKEFLKPMGAQGADIADRIIGFVDNIQVGVLGVVGLALLVYSVIALMHKIELAFNDIWRVPATRSYAVRVRDYLSVLLIGPFLLFLSVGMTASVQHAEFLAAWLDVDIIGTTVDWIFRFVPYLLFTFAFAAIYMFMPNTRVRAVPALVAGLVTGVMWKLLGKLFGVFVAGSASYAAIYSAFAALILFMIWLYAGWLVVLVGAQISYYLQNPSNQRLSRNILRISLQARYRLALNVCAAVGLAFYRHQQVGLSLPGLSARLRVPVMLVEDVVASLIHGGILAETKDRLRLFVPAVPFDETLVDDIFIALDRVEENGAVPLAAAENKIEMVLAKAESARRQSLAGMTLKQLALEGEKT